MRRDPIPRNEEVPHLGAGYPRGNCYKGKPIAQEAAAKLRPNGKRGQTTGLLYDESLPGFSPRAWPVVVDKDCTARRVVCMPPDGGETLSDEQRLERLVDVQRDAAGGADPRLFPITERMISKHRLVRDKGGWGGVGGMVGMGDRLGYDGQLCKFKAQEFTNTACEFQGQADLDRIRAKAGTAMAHGEYDLAQIFVAQLKLIDGTKARIDTCLAAQAQVPAQAQAETEARARADDRCGRRCQLDSW